MPVFHLFFAALPIPAQMAVAGSRGRERRLKPMMVVMTMRTILTVFWVREVVTAQGS